MKKLRSPLGEDETTQRSAMAATTNPFRMEGQREVTVLLGPRAGVIQQKLKSQEDILAGAGARGKTQPLSKMHSRQREMEGIVLTFPVPSPSSVRAAREWHPARSQLT